MSNIIQIKRSSTATTAPSLADGELAYSSEGATETLWIGTAGGEVAIGGEAFTTKLDGIEAGATADQLASEVPFTPNGDIASTNVQAAIVEVRDETDTKLSGKANTSHTHTASEITDFDTEVSNNSSVTANTAKVSADGSVTTHNDVTDAGSGAIITSVERSKLSGIAAGATVGATWSSNITGQPAQVSGAEITAGTSTAEKIWSPADVVSAISQHTVSFTPSPGDYSASDVTNDSTVTGTNVDDALEHLDSAKLELAGGTMTGLLTLSAAPTADLHAATKLYVDTAVAGLDPKGAVRVATTGNITLSGTQTIDGVSLSAGDRVLVKDQSTASQNGIYDVAVGSWTRSEDADGSPANEVTNGMYTFAVEGTTNGGFGFILTTADPIVVDTTDLTFVVFSSAAAPVSSVNGLTGAVTLTSDNVANNSTVTGAFISDALETNAAAAVSALSRSNHTGTQTVSTLSDYTSATNTLISNATLDGGTF